MEVSSQKAIEELGLQHKYLLSNDPRAPLIFMVHGRAGSQDVMWAFRRCVPEYCSIVAPQAPLPDPIGGFSWWDVNVNSNPLEGAKVSCSDLESFISKAPAYYGLNPRKIVAIGFSQGAGMLTYLAQTSQLQLDGLGLLAGFVIRVPELERIFCKLPPIFIAHGDQDEIVPLARAREGIDYLKALGGNPTLQLDPVGHKVGATGMRALKEWLSKQI